MLKIDRPKSKWTVRCTIFWIRKCQYFVLPSLAYMKSSFYIGALINAPYKRKEFFGVQTIEFFKEFIRPVPKLSDRD